MQHPTTATDPPAKIGPGLLILVVGPSGAGKDTLIARARAALSPEPDFVFARRVVTRPSGAWEEHDRLTPQAFAEALARGRFALTWNAHGLHYGLPREIDEPISRGCRVVCNVSRQIVGAAGQYYRQVRV